jgi:acyl-CoA dehydrogenase
MAFEPSPKVQDLQRRLLAFMDAHIYPNEDRHLQQVEQIGPWQVSSVLDELKPKARAAGLWNLFLPESPHGPGLTNLEYAPLCETMGRSLLAPEVLNCSAPDTGNMEVLARYGTPEQQARWLTPLLAGEIRSCFAMTEPAVASSDATNIEASIRRDGDEYVINGHKWYTTNATDPRCKIAIFMGKTDPDNADRHHQQSMVLVPMDTPGVRVVRPLPVFGFYGTPDRASEVVFENVRVPVANILLGEGRGFEIAQGRLGPGRIHHCMRLIGLVERTLERMCRRALSRVAFGKTIAEQGVTLERIADARILIEQARLLTLNAAERMDEVGNKLAKTEIAMIKVAVPNMACQVIDWAIQIHGGGGTSNDFGLTHAYAMARLLRLADGPDEVHRAQLGKLELRKYA